MKGARRILGIVLVVLTLSAGLVEASEEQPLSNSDVIKLTRLAMGDEVVISKIKTAKAVNFDTSTDDLVKLKESGVSGPVIAAMLDRSVSGTVTETKTATVDSSERSCLAHFENKGNLFFRRFNTWQEFTGIDYDTVFRKVTQAAMMAGYRDINGNTGTGTITGGGGAVNIIVRETGKGVIRVDATMKYDTLSNLKFTEGRVKELLCKIIEAPSN